MVKKIMLLIGVMASQDLKVYGRMFTGKNVENHSLAYSPLVDALIVLHKNDIAPEVTLCDGEFGSIYDQKNLLDMNCPSMVGDLQAAVENLDSSVLRRIKANWLPSVQDTCVKLQYIKNLLNGKSFKDRLDSIIRINQDDHLVQAMLTLGLDPNQQVSTFGYNPRHILLKAVFGAHFAAEGHKIALLLLKNGADLKNVAKEDIKKLVTEIENRGSIYSDELIAAINQSLGQ